MSNLDAIVDTGTTGEAWTLPHGALTGTVCLQVIRDAVGVVATLSVDLATDADTSTLSAVLSALVSAQSGPAAQMKAGAA